MKPSRGDLQREGKQVHDREFSNDGETGGLTEMPQWGITVRAAADQVDPVFQYNGKKRKDGADPGKEI